MFKKLTPEQEIPYRQWARNNYKPFEQIDGCWHPLVQAECCQMNREAGERISASMDCLTGSRVE